MKHLVARGLNVNEEERLGQMQMANLAVIICFREQKGADNDGVTIKFKAFFFFFKHTDRTFLL